MSNNIIWATALALSFLAGVIVRQLRLVISRKHAGESHYRAIFECANEGILVVDAARGRVLDANPALVRKLAYLPEHMRSLDVSDILIEIPMPRDRQRTNRPTTLAGVTREIMLKTSTGTFIAVDIAVSPIRIGGEPAVVYVIRDATQRKAVETTLLERHSEAHQRAQYLAQYDPLTGLANRESLKANLTEALAAADPDYKLALLLLDVKDFRSLNDTFGQGAGDAVLKEVAARLRRVVEGRGQVARVGSDEFALTLEQAAEMDKVMAMASEVLKALAMPLRYMDHEIDLAANIGINLCASPPGDVERLFGNADIALSMAKTYGRNTVQVFELEMDAQVRQRLNLVHGLKRALRANELKIHYQPIVDIATRKVLSLEALVRWQHPELGLISPAEFMPIAEESGLVVALGERVLRLVCEQVVEWEKRNVPVVTVAVNVSAQQFQRQSMSTLVQNILRETGMSARHLALEITEGSLMGDVHRYASDLQALRSLGVRILVDDFGTGYSSLSYLKHLPLDALKIDRSFIKNIDTDSADEAIVSAILAMAGSLGLKVIAEGVESQEQLAKLERHGCEMAQGYYFTRPVSAEQCAMLLHEVAKRPSFTETLRMRLSGVANGKPRLTVVQGRGQ